jgi:hypothetical protein
MLLLRPASCIGADSWTSEAAGQNAPATARLQARPTDLQGYRHQRHAAKLRANLLPASAARLDSPGKGKGRILNATACTGTCAPTFQCPFLLSSAAAAAAALCVFLVTRVTAAVARRWGVTRSVWRRRRRGSRRRAATPVRRIGSGRPRTGRSGAGRAGRPCGDATPKRASNRILASRGSAAKPL